MRYPNFGQHHMVGMGVLGSADSSDSSRWAMKVKKSALYTQMHVWVLL